MHVCTKNGLYLNPGKMRMCSGLLSSKSAIKVTFLKESSMCQGDSLPSWDNSLR